VLHATEKALRNALHILNARTGPSAKQAEQEGYGDIARQLSFKVSGGTPQMQTEQRVDQEIFAIPDVWCALRVLEMAEPNLVPCQDYRRCGWSATGV
jgi:hypothetical protein